MEVPLTYPCSTCNALFATKSDRDTHFRRICQLFVTLIDLNGTVIRIERIDGKFKCLGCRKQYNRSDTLTSHWKKCQTTQEPQSKCDKSEKLMLTFIVQMDYENPLIEYLHYDGTYQVAICDKCKHALPKEWIKGHFKDVHEVLV